MPDAFLVFPPGWRLTDESGNPSPGGRVSFFDAGTTTPRTVYSDAALTTSLGTTVYTDTGGYPVSSQGSTNKVQVYIGTGNFKASGYSSAGVALWTADLLPGALNTSGFGGGGGGTETSIPVATKVANYTIVDGDRGTMVAGNTTGGGFTFTLPSAVSVGNGWCVYVQKTSASNTLTIATVSSQTINTTEGSATTLALTANGSSVLIISDGAGWRTHGYSEVEVSAQLATINSTLSGKAEQTITMTAAGLVTGGGTLAANRTFTVTAGTQADMEAETSTTTAVVPARVHFNPGIAKSWVNFNGTGTAAIRESERVSSITDHGTGDYTINLSTAFSAATYAVVASSSHTGATGPVTFAVNQGVAPTTTAVRVANLIAANTAADVTYCNVACFGDF